MNAVGIKNGMDVCSCWACRNALKTAESFSCQHVLPEMPVGMDAGMPRPY
jgi:hypothetical protein